MIMLMLLSNCHNHVDIMFITEGVVTLLPSHGTVNTLLPDNYYSTVQVLPIGLDKNSRQ